jgi:peptide/nickel transport system permease protein
MIDQYAGTTSGADRGAARGVLATLVRRKLALFGMAVILLTSFLAVAAPLVAPYPYEEQLADGISDDGAPLPPNLKYLLGTDLLGRDLMSRRLGCTQPTVIGVAANGASVLTVRSRHRRGILAAGSGPADASTDLMMAFRAHCCHPAGGTLQPEPLIVALVIAMVNWVQVARMFTPTRSIARQDFTRRSGAGG